MFNGMNFDTPSVVSVSSNCCAFCFAIGLVISTGLAIGTLFTLFVVPGVYMLIGADHSAHTNEEPADLSAA